MCFSLSAGIRNTVVRWPRLLWHVFTYLCCPLATCLLLCVFLLCVPCFPSRRFTCSVAKIGPFAGRTRWQTSKARGNFPLFDNNQKILTHWHRYRCHLGRTPQDQGILPRMPVMFHAIAGDFACYPCVSNIFWLYLPLYE